MLTVTKIVPRTNSNTRCEAVCECGVSKTYELSNLKRGHVKSCGCVRFCGTKPTHGLSKTRLYKTYLGMIARCYDSTKHNYSHYGGRGITVCEEWRSDVSAFQKWAVENGYNDNLQIDRIENNKGYSPDNCRFVTPKQNANNKSDNRLITLNGITKTVAQWAEEKGVTYNTIWNRVKRGWDVAKAIETPMRLRMSNKPMYVIDISHAVASIPVRKYVIVT